MRPVSTAYATISRAPDLSSGSAETARTGAESVPRSPPQLSPTKTVTKRRALLIGVATFDDENVAPLAEIPRDIDLLSKALRSHDGPQFDDVIHCTQNDGPVTVSRMRSAIESFLRAGGSQPSDINLIYIGSHGKVDAFGSLHIIPQDYRPHAPLATSLPMSFLGACLQYAKSSPTVLLLDCCYADRGAWETLHRAATPFFLPAEERPTYCVIAACRHDEPAYDGAFAPVFAKALTTVDPPPGRHGEVSLDQIHDYVARVLQDRGRQTPRLWQSRTSNVFIGRRLPGIRLTKDALESLYRIVFDRKLVSPDGNTKYAIDYVEHQTTPQGFNMRTGIRVLSGDVDGTRVSNAVDALNKIVGSRSVDHGIVLVTDASRHAHLSSQHVLVRSYQDFRCALMPLFSYLGDWIAKYEDDERGVFRRDCYIGIRAHAQGCDNSFNLGDAVLSWAAYTGSPSILVVLGEFGVGKTTTAKHVFWTQARLYSQNPSAHRIPIFVSLRDFDRAFDMETLVERTIARQGLVTFSAVSRLNAEGRVLWILDGFDEMAVRVTGSVMSKNFDEILKLAGKSSKILLTCRTSFFKRGEEAEHVFKGTELYDQLRKDGDDRFGILNVEPLSPEEIEGFVRARAGDGADALLATLSSNPSMSNLASRPILLEMIVFTLPEMIRKGVLLNLANLYGEYTGALLRRDAWRHVMVTEEDRISFCQELAWHFLRTSSYEITYRELPEFTKRLFPEAARRAEEFEALERAIRSTSFLVRDDAGNFAFAHKSFLEFFAASYVLRDLAAGKILSLTVLQPEVVRFLAQMLATTPSLVDSVARAASSATFSVRYFLSEYLAPRFVPVLRGKSAVHHVQRQSNHVLLHVGVPVLVCAAVAVALLVPDFGLERKSLLETLVIALAGPIVGTVLVHFTLYLIRALGGEVGHPVQRFNALTILDTLDTLNPDALLGAGLSRSESSAVERRLLIQKLCEELPVDERAMGRHMELTLRVPTESAAQQGAATDERPRSAAARPPSGPRG